MTQVPMSMLEKRIIDNLAFKLVHQCMCMNQPISVAHALFFGGLLAKRLSLFPSGYK